jgi:hypothetical protein
LNEFQKQKVAHLLELIESNQLPFDNQEHNFDNGKPWTCDMWSIEVLKYLKNTEKFSLYKDYGDRKLKVIKELKKIKSLPDNLLVCEVGRGIDILLATFVKNWKRIICYDINPVYGELVVDYFKKIMNISVEFYQANSGDIYFNNKGLITFRCHATDMGKDVLLDNCVMISENTRISSLGFKEACDNPNIKVIIQQGNIIKNINE